MINGARPLTQDFYLPGAMSADELCDALHDGKAATRKGPSVRLRSVGAFPKWVHTYLEGIHRRFAEPLMAAGSQQTTCQIRERLREAISDARVFERDLLICSPEGAGKTSRLFDEIALEIFDAALSRPLGQHQFACFAFRSSEQAQAKAKEYRQTGEYRQAVVLRSFWYHYQNACTRAGSAPIPGYEFPDHSLNGILRQIKSKQPSVFEELEECRRSLWVRADGRSLFDSAMTVLFTNHDLAKTWHRNRKTRLWHHPEFRPFADQDHEAMRKDLTISYIVFDEPETDTLLHVLPERLFLLLDRTQQRFPGWGNRTRSERHQIFMAERKAGELHDDLKFEEIDELMRLDLGVVNAREVNYDALPFGCDQPGKGIYSAQNGRRFYLGMQGWLKQSMAHLTFLTTETWVSEVLARILDHEQSTRDLIVLELNPSCDLFPVEVPLVVDGRAAMDRQGKPKIRALAEEILRVNPRAIIIANGTKLPDPRVKTFLRAKGLNGLNDNDIFVIPTFLSPEQYAELNVIAGWLDIPDAIQRFYEDQISQAVGRNTGFRSSKRPTKTVLICSNRLARMLRACFRDSAARIRLTTSKTKPGPGVWQ